MNKKKYIYCEINHLTFMLRYILVVTVEMKVENDGRENTIVSSHTFVPGSDGIIIILVTGITMYIHLFPLRTDFVNF